MQPAIHPFWQIAWLKPLNDIHAVDSLLQRINARWSLHETRASVKRIVWETEHVFSLYLKPNRHFKSFKAGQHVALTVECDGRLESRVFSLSDAPGKNGLLRFTIKINDNGTVSKAISGLRIGDIIRLSQAQGDFYPEPEQNSLLFIAAGSGITPIMALLNSMKHAKQRMDCVLVYCVRNAKEFIFKQELETLVQHLPNFVLQVIYSENAGRLTQEKLKQLVPDLTQRQSFACGPGEMLDWLSQFYDSLKIGAQLHLERFQQQAIFLDENAQHFQIVNAENAPLFQAPAGQALLLAAETQGLKPAHGCRRGICMSCQCKKISGVVFNQLTQTTSKNGEQWIQLCVSTPLSNLQLDMQA